jgi:hypothetical protein
MQSLLHICSPVISQLSGRCGPPSATLNLNTLAGLPVELLLSITDFLPVDDRICISLCSHRLFAIFNRRYNSARPSGKMKLPVLRRLERDLPKYFICHICFILHKYDGSECFGLSGPMTDGDSCPLRCFPPWIKCPAGLELLDGEKLYWFYVYRRFHFLHLQLAMRRFHLGDQFGISTEALSYTQVRIHPEESSCPEITSLFSTDAQIISKTPGLCSREQYVMFVHGSRSELLLYQFGSKFTGQPPQTMFTCAHVRYKQKAKLLNTVVFAYLDREKNTCSTYTCNQCDTDSRVGSLRIWFSYGPGLTPDDPRWQIHSWEYRDVTLDPNDRTDSLRVAFENASSSVVGGIAIKNPFLPQGPAIQEGHASTF